MSCKKQTISEVEVILTADGSWCLLHPDDDPRENKWIDPDEVEAIRAALRSDSPVRGRLGIAYEDGAGLQHIAFGVDDDDTRSIAKQHSGELVNVSVRPASTGGEPRYPGNRDFDPVQHAYDIGYENGLHDATDGAVPVEVRTMPLGDKYEYHETVSRGLEPVKDGEYWLIPREGI